MAQVFREALKDACEGKAVSSLEPDQVTCELSIGDSQGAQPARQP